MISLTLHVVTLWKFAPFDDAVMQKQSSYIHVIMSAFDACAAHPTAYLFVQHEPQPAHLHTNTPEY
jgi:hypothetical protein